MMSKQIEKENSRKTNPQSICMIGALPPPVHGMAAVNAEVRDQLIETKKELHVFNIGSRNLERSFLSKMSRVSTIISQWVRFICTRNLLGATLYMTPSGGYGQVYDILFLVVARIRKMKIYIHHHSFAYLDRYFWVADLLTKIAGAATVHVTLSEGMSAKLRKKYSIVETIVPISNATFFSDSKAVSKKERTSLKTIGFISNIAKEKGIFDFIELLEACERNNLPIRGKIAGPFQDDENEKEFNQRINNLTTVDYVGPQYGAEKAAFFDSIDVLIFPTRYANEAEPVTIHEAMKVGLPVIAFGRGSIPELIDPQCGLVIEPDASFVSAALEKLTLWHKNPEEYKIASNSASERFALAMTMNENRWLELLNEMVAGLPSKA